MSRPAIVWGPTIEAGGKMKLGISTGAITHGPGRRRSWTVWFLGALLVMAFAATSAQAAEPPAQDPFYKYEGKPTLKHIAPGTVLKTRTRALPHRGHRTAGHGRAAPVPLDLGARQADRQRDLGAAAAGETRHLRCSPTSPSTTASTPKTTRPTRSPVATRLGRRNPAGRVGADRAGAARGRDRRRPRHRGRGSGLLAPGPCTATTRSTRCARRSARLPQA